MTLLLAAKMLALMISAHALADYPLQGDFLAQAKSRFRSVPGVPWWQALLAHGAIHGGAVGLITDSLTLGFLEYAAHCLIDDAKCAGRFGFNTDQALHISCKVVWVGLLWQFGPLP